MVLLLSTVMILMIPFSYAKTEEDRINNAVKVIMDNQRQEMNKLVGVTTNYVAQGVSGVSKRDASGYDVKQVINSQVKAVSDSILSQYQSKVQTTLQETAKLNGDANQKTFHVQKKLEEEWVKLVQKNQQNAVINLDPNPRLSKRGLQGAASAVKELLTGTPSVGRAVSDMGTTADNFRTPLSSFGGTIADDLSRVNSAAEAVPVKETFAKGTPMDDLAQSSSRVNPAAEPVIVKETFAKGSQTDDLAQSSSRVNPAAEPVIVKETFAKGSQTDDLAQGSSRGNPAAEPEIVRNSQALPNSNFESQANLNNLNGASRAANQQPILPPGWTAAVTPEGRTYYFNPITKTSQWEVPLPLVFDPRPLPKGWTREFDPSGNAIYKGPNGEFSNAHPLKPASADDFARTQAAQDKAIASARKTVPVEYTRHWDPTTNKLYYFNAKTGHSTYTYPYGAVAKKANGDFITFMNTGWGKVIKTVLILSVVIWVIHEIFEPPGNWA